MIDYCAPGRLTTLESLPAEALPKTDDPLDICAPVAELFMQPSDAVARGLNTERLSENDIRPAVQLVTHLLALDPAPLTLPREPTVRVVGTCRHFAVLACALLRHRGIASRVRCGFATYFVPRRAVDHWIIEYRDQGRWIRLDPEILGKSVVEHPEDLVPG